MGILAHRVNRQVRIRNCDDNHERIIFISKIKVIDAPCGAGKSSWAIQTMKSAPDTSFIYCTPFLDEISRVRNSCGHRFIVEPNNYGTTKIEDFNRLLAEGCNIAVTHSTFINATPETITLIEQGEYVLLLDEALEESVTEFNNLSVIKNSPEQKIKHGDIEMLIDSKLISVATDGKVTWIGNEYQDSKFTELQRLSKLGRLYLAQDKLMLCLFPPEIFNSFQSVYVMTYLFNGCFLKYYFDLFNIEYELASINENDGKYSLVDYEPQIDLAHRQQCKELITICDNERLNDGYKKGAFSVSWCNSNLRDPEVAKRIRTDLTYFFCRIAKAKSGNEDIMWTCLDDWRTKLQGKGYTCVRQLTAEEKLLPPGKLKELEKDVVCHVPVNARATNRYANRWALAYLFNMRMNPMVKGFFNSNDVEINEDMFSTACLIQWIFRSRIRNAQPIMIYIPSPRMRQLLQRWLDGADLVIGEEVLPRGV